MTALSVYLFGRFTVESGIEPVSSLNGAKVQELFSYLLLHGERPHLRETLTTLLWADVPPSQAKSYLRKAIWQLQTALAQLSPPDSESFLCAEGEWLQVNGASDLWFDVAQFEHAYRQVEDIAGEAIDPATAARIEAAVEHYRGDLLEGWYQEWVLFERERLERMYLALVDKLISHCAARGRYEAGIGYGMRALRHDPARERTHRRLMRLHYLAGNRSEALHQYALCVETLRRELDVIPSERTNALYRRILAESNAARDSYPVTGRKEAEELRSEATPGDWAPSSSNGEARDTLRQLEQMLRLLGETQQLVQRNINHVAATLDDLLGSRS